MKKAKMIAAGALVAAMLMVSVPVNAEPTLDWTWTRTDTIMQTTWTAIHVLDWSQTRKIAKNPDQYFERNPILGRHPSVGEVDAYMAITTVANVAIARSLPHPYRRYFQGLSIVVSTGYVGLNFSIGLGGGDWF